MEENVILRLENVSVTYYKQVLIAGVFIDFKAHQITGIIGRSGCGKTTLLRCLNRLNDLIEGMRVQGKVLFKGEDIYQRGTDLVELRRRIGMVFQRPAPFPTSIYDNIAFPLRANGYPRAQIKEIVELALTKVGLWDEVKYRLNHNALTLSGGQQQRLCIARAIAIQPEVLLLDEPCSALDPVSTLEIEKLLLKLKEDYTIIMTSHDLRQVARICDEVVYMDVEENARGGKTGYVVEHNTVEKIFLNPDSRKTYEYTTAGLTGLTK